MKTLAFLIATYAITFTTIAGNPTNEHGEKYCAKNKNGKLTIMHEGKELTTETTLANGTRISLDGTVTKADGTTMMLKEGECMDLEGKIIDKKSATPTGTGTNTNKNATNPNQNNSNWNKSSSGSTKTGTGTWNNGTNTNGTGTNGSNTNGTNKKKTTEQAQPPKQKLTITTKNNFNKN